MSITGVPKGTEETGVFEGLADFQPYEKIGPAG